MFTPDERRALLFLAAVAAAGGLVRVVRSGSAPTDAPGAALVAPEISGGDIARQSRLARRAEELARPLRPGERVDVDRAEAAELERLPRVGRDLAQRILEERAANGPFGSLEGLSRVPGVGPSTIRSFERYVTFSGVASFPAHVYPVAVSCPPEPIALNSATADQLACLPGIGPALAARIVTFRTARGPFREVKELQQVPGIGPARLERLAPRLRAP